MEKIEGGATIWARQTIDSDIFRNKPDKWFKIWFYIICKVKFMDQGKFRRGENFIKYEWISEATGASKAQIDHFMRWAKEAQMLATQKATRGMTVNVLTYAFYQDLENYKSDSKSDLKATQERHYTKECNNDKNLFKEKKPNTPRGWVNLRRSEAGKEPLLSERTEKQQRAFEVMKLMDYYRDQAYSLHGLSYFGREADRNKKLYSLMEATLERFGKDTKTFLDWILDFGGQKENYEPEWCLKGTKHREWDNLPKEKDKSRVDMILESYCLRKELDPAKNTMLMIDAIKLEDYPNEKITEAMDMCEKFTTWNLSTVVKIIKTI